MLSIQCLFEFAPRFIRQTNPDKMKDLVGEQEPEQGWILYERVLKHDTAFPEKACSVYRFAALRLGCQQPAAMRRQSREELQMDRSAIDIGQPGKITTEPVAHWPALNSHRRKCFVICRASVGREQGEH